MGRIKRLFDLANGKLPSYNSAFLKVRGIAHPIDTFLTGTLRFSRKIGGVLPIWLPDNQTSLASAITSQATRLSVNEIIPWITIGSKLLIDSHTFVFVDDLLEEGRVILLEEPLLIGYDTNTTIDLYAHPLELNGTFSPPVTTAATVPTDFVTGLQPRISSQAVADTNQALLGEPVIDGVTLITGQRVLLVGQTDPTENGLWEVSVFSWSRPSDFTGGSNASRAQVFSLGGTSYTGTSWICTSAEDSDTISDPFSALVIVGVPLTWAQMSTVTTFVVHSDYPIYVGDAINFGFFDYDVVQALESGTTTDGRTTYQLTIDVGIPTTLEDARKDQVYLRAHPSYESGLRPVPVIPLTQTSIGPFLYDRVSGSFFEDLDVEEVDNVSTYNGAGTLLTTENNAGKNYLLYNRAISPDSFLFWDLSQGKLNFSRERQTFVAYTDDDGKFHLHFECVPSIAHEEGFEGWRVQVTPENDCYMIVQLEPNSVLAPFTTRAVGASPPPPDPRGGVFLAAGSTTPINIDFPAGSSDISMIHIMFDSETVPGTPQANTRVDMESWEIRGVQTTAFVKHTTIAKVTGRNVWASSSAFAKPYWLRLAYLEVQTDLYSRFNSGLLAL